MKLLRIVVMKLKAKADCVLDASALMSLVNNEPGAASVQQHLDKACISSVNFTEVLSKMLEQGVPIADAERVLSNFNLEIIAFDETQISGTSLLRLTTKQYGLSIADRVCLNLGKMLKLAIFTTDQAWEKINDPSMKIVLTR